MDHDVAFFRELKKYGGIFSSSMDDYLYVYDLRDDYYYISERALERFDIPAATFRDVLNTLRRFVYEEDFEILKQDVDDIINGKKADHNLQYRWLGRKGNPIWINCRGRVVCDEADCAHKYLVGCINEIGVRQKADNVSGLLGVRVFRDSLCNMPDVPSGFVLRIGIDHFKELNERMGTDYGDRVLRDVADCIRQSLRPEEKVYRILGDEFLILNESGGTNEDAKVTYRNIRGAIDRHLEKQHYEVVYTISGGVFSNREVTTLDYNIFEKKSQFSLNRAKELGRNRLYVYRESDYQKFLREERLTRELRDAVFRDMQGFEVYYQPLVSLEDERLYAAESLLRFVTGDGESIAPAEFIPLLESSGLIIPVGRWVMSEALHMCEQCQKVYPNFKVTINLSYVQLLKSGVYDDLMQLFSTVDVKPDSVILELTESGHLEDTPAVQDVWEKMKDYGVMMAVDDFGTGYSNLNNLGSMKPNIVKIDRSLTLKALTNEYERRMLEYITEMVHGIGLQLVVEGIENDRELEKIKAMNPDFIQGYYYSHPCNKHEFQEKFSIPLSE